VHNALDMLNVCIAPTRLCNLSCTHCYVDPALLRDKSMMDEGTYRESFQRIEELFCRDKKVTKINVELLGGELTMMPLQFWERNLPWTLKTMKAWETLYDAEAALIWCTNLIFKDPGYIDLLNSVGTEFGYGIDIFVPWEPDTNRFLKNDKLLPRYFATLEAITGIKRKTLCITMSRGVIERGPQFIVDEFVSRGITDISCDMLYPAGSGKSYFLKTCTYGDVSDYLLELNSLVPQGVTISPLVEMRTASRSGEHYHYPGNDSYDIEIEPNGQVTFNSSYTGNESIFPTQTLSVHDPLFSAKAIFNNTPEYVSRHRMPYQACGTCKFAITCSGGWAWHKDLDPNMSSLIASGDCAGLKRVWDFADETTVGRLDRAGYLRRTEARRRQGGMTKRLVTTAVAKGKDVPLIEDCVAGNYDKYFTEFDRARLVAMKPGKLFEKRWVERLFFYDAIGAQIDDYPGWYVEAADEGGEELYRHIVYGNFHFLEFDPVAVFNEIRYRGEWYLSKLMMRTIQELEGCLPVGAETIGGSHEEMIQFCSQVIQMRERAA
jgi:hypothetical protein